GFENGSTVPGIVGYESDYYNCQYGLPPHTSYALLSSSPMRDGDGFTQNMNAAIYRSTSGAWVFSAGTMSWAWALEDKVDPSDPDRQRNLHDPRIERATANLLDVFVGKATGVDQDAGPPPCTYDKQMTFEDGVLTGPSGANRTVGAVEVESSGPLTAGTR